jgi:ADP-ribosyl-[dinitrogen reductase] hydrolase
MAYRMMDCLASKREMLVLNRYTSSLGDDADTTAAICGQIAGAFYGVEGIPAHWLEKLHMRGEITIIAEHLACH